MRDEIATEGGGLALCAPSILEDFSRFVDARPTTLRAYINGVKSFFRHCAARNIASPGRQHVIEWRDCLKRRCKPASVATYLAGLRRFFSWAAMRGLWEDIAAGIKGPKQGREFRRDALTRQQARALLAGIERESLLGKRDYAMIALMLTAGLRDCEASRANIGDLRNVAGAPVLFLQGKGRDGASEYVKVGPNVEKALRAWLAARGRAQEDEPLFARASNNGRGMRLSPAAISAIVKGRLVAAGLCSSRLTAHSLRHTAATEAIRAGNSLEDVRIMLRHASIDTTRLYVHQLGRQECDCELSNDSAFFD